jgi:type IV secretory pathway TrbD component
MGRRIIRSVLILVSVKMVDESIRLWWRLELGFLLTLLCAQWLAVADPRLPVVRARRLSTRGLMRAF